MKIQKSILRTVWYMQIICMAASIVPAQADGLPAGARDIFSTPPGWYYAISEDRPNELVMFYFPPKIPKKPAPIPIILGPSEVKEFLGTPAVNTVLTGYAEHDLSRNPAILQAREIIKGIAIEPVTVPAPKKPPIYLELLNHH